MRGRRAAKLILFLLIGLSPGGCSTVLESMSAGLAYRQARLPKEQIRLDVPYRTDAAAHPNKHRLDLFLPDAVVKDWPTLIFVHGGGWTDGDRTTSIFGLQPMRNIGRFYAARGIGTAVLSYRLQPSVSWRDQVEDVADATSWVHREIARYGGDPESLYIAGHSAGAWLAAWVGLSDIPLARVNMDRSRICGLILVSGAGYDLEDEETYALGASREYFEELFADDDPNWAHAASISQQLDSPIPAVLILSAAGEPEKFRHQGDLLFEAIKHDSPTARRVVVPGQNHQRIVVSMSRSDDPVSRLVLDFLAGTSCSSGSD